MPVGGAALQRQRRKRTRAALRFSRAIKNLRHALRRFRARPRQRPLAQQGLDSLPRLSFRAHVDRHGAEPLQLLDRPAPSAPLAARGVHDEADVAQSVDQLVPRQGVPDSEADGRIERGRQCQATRC